MPRAKRGGSSSGSRRRRRGDGGSASGVNKRQRRREQWEEVYGPTEAVDFDDTQWEEEMLDDAALEALEREIMQRERLSPAPAASIASSRSSRRKPGSLRGSGSVNLEKHGGVGGVGSAPFVPRYDLTTMKLTGIVMCVGRPGSGKSFFIAEVMWFMRDKLDLVLGFNPSESSSRTLKPFTPDACKYGNFSIPKMERILDFQRECLLEAALLRDQMGLEDVEELPPQYKNFFRVGVIADDCMKEKAKINSPLMVDIAYQHRHLKLLFLVAVQYIMAIHPKIRDCIWYVALFFDPNVKAQAKMMENVCSLWGQGADALWQFRNYYLTCTYGGIDPATGDPRNKHCCMFVDHQRSGKTKDRIFCYKASPKPPRFRVGRRRLVLGQRYYEKEPLTLLQIKQRQKARLDTIREEAVVRKALENGEIPGAALQAAGVGSSGKKGKRPPLPGDEDEEDVYVTLQCEDPVDPAAQVPVNGRSSSRGSSGGGGGMSREEALIRSAAEAYRGRRYRHEDRPDPYTAAHREAQAFEVAERSRRRRRREDRSSSRREDRSSRREDRSSRREDGNGRSTVVAWDPNNPLQAAAFMGMSHPAGHHTR